MGRSKCVGTSSISHKESTICMIPVVVVLRNRVYCQFSDVLTIMKVEPFSCQILYMFIESCYIGRMFK